MLLPPGIFGNLPKPGQSKFILRNLMLCPPILSPSWNRNSWFRERLAHRGLRGLLISMTRSMSLIIGKEGRNKQYRLLPSSAKEGRHKCCLEMIYMEGSSYLLALPDPLLSSDGNKRDIREALHSA